MALTLNHFSIRTTDLEASRRFYADILGLSVGPRPPFPLAAKATRSPPTMPASPRWSAPMPSGLPPGRRE